MQLVQILRLQMRKKAVLQCPLACLVHHEIGCSFLTVSACAGSKDRVMAYPSGSAGDFARFLRSGQVWKMTGLRHSSDQYKSAVECVLPVNDY